MILPLLLIWGLLTLLPGPALACLNDRDTDSLASEGGDLPEIVQVITGRFERNPPLFYQMRIKYLKQELSEARDALLFTLEPDPYLRLFDDIAVAYDRLGDSGEALQWIEKKHRAIEEIRDYPRGIGQPSPLTSTVEKEHRYRYFANAGTFLAHRWLRQGATSERLGEMEKARDYIARALKLKPDAHFGRERYQLRAMDWILEQKTGKMRGSDSGKPYQPRSLSSYLEREAEAAKESPESALQGLAGLIVLGNAWESVDIFQAQARFLYRMHRARVGYLASLRVEELVKQGKKSLDNHNPDLSDPQKALQASLRSGHERPGHQAVTWIKYRELRQEAEEWQADRTRYMLSRLKAGRHPDREPGFWADFNPPPPPGLEIPWQEEFEENFAQVLQPPRLAANIALLANLVLVGVFVHKATHAMLRWRKRQGRKT